MIALRAIAGLLGIVPGWLWAILLAGALGHGCVATLQRDHARNSLTAAQLERDQAKAAAQACSDGVARLQEAAKQRDLAAAKERAKAKTKATTLESRAGAILATPATVPGDDCKSASDRLDGWWQGRAAK